MDALVLHTFHESRGARFTEINGCEVVETYGDIPVEYRALRETAAVIDFSFRGRICLTGADRQRFLHGQVTNDVNRLKTGQGCYAALTTAKGKMVSDLNIYVLENEILLDFEPGLTREITERLEKYIIADDVQIIDVGSLYGLLTVQGPAAPEMLQRLDLGVEWPTSPMAVAHKNDPILGEIYVMNLSRTGSKGFDLFVPVAGLEEAAKRLVEAVQAQGGALAGWAAFETARIEAGIPRFGADMDATNLPPEAGLEKRAISYNKGCYIGQEVIARIRTYGQVAKAFRGLRIIGPIQELPRRGDKLFKGDKEVGYLTSVVVSPTLNAPVALGYVRREANQIGSELNLRSGTAEVRVQVVEAPFV